MASMVTGPSALDGMMDDLGISRQDDLPMTDRHREGSSGYRPGRSTGFGARLQTGQAAASGWGVLAKDGIHDAESEGVRGLDNLGGGRIHAAGHDEVQSMIRNVGARQQRATQEAARLTTTTLGGLHRQDVPVRIFVNSRHPSASHSTPSATRLTETSGSGSSRPIRPAQTTRTAHAPQSAQHARPAQPRTNAPPIPANQGFIVQNSGWDTVLAQAGVRHRTISASPATVNSVPAAAASPVVPSALPTASGTSQVPPQVVIKPEEPTSHPAPVNISTPDDGRQGGGWGKPGGQESQDTKDAGPGEPNGPQRQQMEYRLEPAVDLRKTTTESAHKSTQDSLVPIVSWPQLCGVTIGTGDRSQGSLTVKLLGQGTNFRIGFIFITGEASKRRFPWEGLKAVDFDIRNEAGQPLPVCKMEFFAKEADGSKGHCALTLNFASMDLFNELKERMKTLRDIMSLNEQVGAGDGPVQDYCDKSTLQVQDGEEVDIAPFIDDAVKHIASRNQIKPEAVTPRLATIFKVVFIRSLQERIRGQEDHGHGGEAPINEKAEAKSSVETMRFATLKKEGGVSAERQDVEADVKKNALVPTAPVFEPRVGLSSMPEVKAEPLSPSPTQLTTAPIESLAAKVSVVQSNQSKLETGNDSTPIDHTSTDLKTEKSDAEDLIDVKTTVALQPIESEKGSAIHSVASKADSSSSQKKPASITTTELRRKGKLVRKTITVEEYVYEDSSEN